MNFLVMLLILSGPILIYTNHVDNPAPRTPDPAPEVYESFKSIWLIPSLVGLFGCLIFWGLFNLVDKLQTKYELCNDIIYAGGGYALVKNNRMYDKWGDPIPGPITQEIIHVCGTPHH